MYNSYIPTKEDTDRWEQEEKEKYNKMILRCPYCGSDLIYLKSGKCFDHVRHLWMSGCEFAEMKINVYKCDSESENCDSNKHENTFYTKENVAIIFKGKPSNMCE